MKFYRGFFLLLFLRIQSLSAQVTDTFRVEGDLDKYYPVTFLDGGFFDKNRMTEIQLSRYVHDNSSWRGPLSANFQFRANAWGGGAEFISANINQGYAGLTVNPFIAGWKDASRTNGLLRIVVWLRGGGTTYHYKSNYAISPEVHDVPLADGSYYKEEGGPSHSFKTSLDPYVNSNGLSVNQSAFFQKPVKTSRLQVVQDDWADFVFEPGYMLPTLKDVEQYINKNRHLPDVPTTSEIREKGIDVGEMNRILLQKVEELTLYMIEQQKMINALQAKTVQLEAKLQAKK